MSLRGPSATLSAALNESKLSLCRVVTLTSHCKPQCCQTGIYLADHDLQTLPQGLPSWCLQYCCEGASSRGRSIVDWLIDLQVISGTGFYGSNDPTNSVNALKCQCTEGREVLRITLQSHQVHPTVLTILQLCSMKQKHTEYTEINTNISTHSEIGPVWRNQSREL